MKFMVERTKRWLAESKTGHRCAMLREPIGLIRFVSRICGLTKWPLNAKLLMRYIAELADEELVR